jgi:uncharacterized protein (TIRG00374 family)
MLTNDRAKRWLKFGVALAISVVFSVFFIRSIDLDAVASALAEADYVYVVPALALFGLSLIARSLRWSYLLEPRHGLGWRDLLPSLLVGYAGNNLLPLRAGELLRAQHLMDHKRVPRMETFGTLMMERLYDGLILAVLVLWGLLLVGVGTAYLGLGLLLFGAAIAGFVVCTALALRPGVARWVAGLPLPFISDRGREIAVSLGESFLAGLSSLKTPRRAVLAGACSIATWLLELAMYWLVSVAFDLHASFLTIAFAGAAANVALSLPSAQGGVGPFHVVATEALLKSGVVRQSAAAYAIALHIFLVVPVSVVGLVVLWRSTLQPAQRPVLPATPESAEQNA